MGYALVFEETSVRIGRGREAATLLGDLDLQVPYGSFAVLTGPSGAGKTTALRVAACVMKPTGGRAEVLGWDTRLVRGSRVAAVRRFVGIVPQGSPYGREHRSVEQALRRSMRASGRGGVDTGGRIQEALQLTGTAHLLHSDVQNLSVGEARRVSIARALLTRPHMLLLDEPTANLDDENAESMLHLLLGARDAGLAVIAATHDRRLLQAADRTAKLS